MSEVKVPKLRAIDLFAGCGGLSLGLTYAGFDVVGAVEVDALAASTYRANHPSTHVWEADIRGVSASSILAAVGLGVGELDLLAGCPPCQGFSSLRTLNGSRDINDARNDLVLQFERFVRDLLPRGIMLENVPGLATNRRSEQLRQVLAELGYTVSEGVLDAQDFGVPQRRRRYVLLAVRSGSVSLATSTKRTLTVARRILRLPAAGRSGDPMHDVQERRSPSVAARIAAIPKDGGSRSALGKDDQLACHQRNDGFKDVYGRMAWNRPAPTITTGCWNPSKGRFLHPEENRAITLREAALLQGFPQNYVFPTRVGKTAIARLIGNAFPPEFARRQALQLRRAISDIP